LNAAIGNDGTIKKLLSVENEKTPSDGESQAPKIEKYTQATRLEKNRQSAALLQQSYYGITSEQCLFGARAGNRCSESTRGPTVFRRALTRCDFARVFLYQFKHFAAMYWLHWLVL